MNDQLDYKYDAWLINLKECGAALINLAIPSQSDQGYKIALLFGTKSMNQTDIRSVSTVEIPELKNKKMNFHIVAVCFLAAFILGSASPLEDIQHNFQALNALSFSVSDFCHTA